MKKCVVMILMVGIFCVGCGKKTAETVEPAFTVTSYVTSNTYETTSEESVQANEDKNSIQTEMAKKENAVEEKQEIVADTNYDFFACEDAPTLSGEVREPDWSMVFDDNCVIIGEDRYPAYMKISEFGSNIALEVVNIGKESPDNPSEILDYYTLCYHGYKACGIIASRTSDVAPENAYICTWTLNGDWEVPKEKMGIFGISMTQSAAEVAAVYLPDELDGNQVNYYGVTERNGEKFGCSFKHNSEFLTMLTITSDEMLPGIYDYYSTK